MFDNSEINVLIEKLEAMEDEALAASLLSEFNAKSRALGLLLMNRDPALSHDEWKRKCDEAQKEVDLVVNKIRSY